MLAIKFLATFFFILAWIMNRRRQSLTITDVFVVVFAVQFLPFFLFNEYATSRWVDLTFNDKTVFRANVGIILFMLIASVTLTAGNYLFSFQPNIASGRRNERFFQVIALSLAGFLFALLLIFGQFREFRVETIQYMFGMLASEDYIESRRFAYADSPSIAILGKLRFSLLPVIFVFIVFPFVSSSRLYIGAGVAVLFFFALPLSLSKAPIILYGGYFAMSYLYVSGRLRQVSTRKILLFTPLSILSLMALLSGLYMLQYRDLAGYQNPFEEPLSLAAERIWGETYSIVLRYFEVYPEGLRFTGIEGIQMLASVLGLEHRNPDLEVPELLLDSKGLTSNPTAFFVTAYANFGFPGLAIGTVIGVLFVQLLDWLHLQIKSEVISCVYFSTLAVNAAFLLQIALPTTLLTYGLAVIPLLLLLLDRVTDHK